jgi:predicted DNA-binding protein (MmcQ/YjbR family)
MSSPLDSCTRLCWSSVFNGKIVLQESSFTRSGKWYKSILISDSSSVVNFSSNSRPISKRNVLSRHLSNVQCYDLRIVYAKVNVIFPMKNLKRVKEANVQKIKVIPPAFHLWKNYWIFWLLHYRICYKDIKNPAKNVIEWCLENFIYWFLQVDLFFPLDHFKATPIYISCCLDLKVPS